jgi:hypothetical protein
MRGLIVVHRQADLLQIVLALATTCRLARGLNCRKKQRDEDADDRDYHKQFN